jgi:hypothetical protein
LRKRRPKNAFVVSGLIKRGAELAGDIEKAHECLHKVVADLENLDATIGRHSWRPRHIYSNKHKGGSIHRPL